jgi:hypothetical protein
MPKAFSVTAEEKQEGKKPKRTPRFYDHYNVEAFPLKEQDERPHVGESRETTRGQKSGHEPGNCIATSPSEKLKS